MLCSSTQILVTVNKEIEFLLYNLPDEEGKVQVVIKDEAILCTQKAMAQLFGCSTDNISLHLKNIFNEGELSPKETTEETSVVQQEGARQVRHLQEKENRQLERAVTSYFDYIENQIERQNAFTMEQFAASVNKFLTFNDYKILRKRVLSQPGKQKQRQKANMILSIRHSE
jgi:hypothetical protein